MAVLLRQMGIGEACVWALLSYLLILPDSHLGYPRRKSGWPGTPVEHFRFLPLWTWLPPSSGGMSIASEVCGSRSQVQGWHDSKFPVQPTDSSIGYGVDVWFHSEMNLRSGDWDFSLGSELTVPKRSSRQNNNNPNLVLIWKLTFVIKSMVSGTGQIAVCFLAPTLVAKHKQGTSHFWAPTSSSAKWNNDACSLGWFRDQMDLNIQSFCYND